MSRGPWGASTFKRWTEKTRNSEPAKKKKSWKSMVP